MHSDSSGPRNDPRRSNTVGSADRPSHSLHELRQHLASIRRLLEVLRMSSGNMPANTIAKLCETTCSLAQVAQTSGLTTYRSIALHVLEQLSSAQRTRHVPFDLVDLLCEWVRRSWAYLLAPADATLATALVEHLGNLRWERPVGRVQRDALIESMQAEAFALIGASVALKTRASRR